jgi:Zn finger protein HypA/HybF involved in hydrogenase expression
VDRYLDHPFDEVAATAQEKIAEGATVYQKFTCAKCGQRLTIEEPNVFFTEGHCDKCGAITDIKKRGCNYLIIFGETP